MTPELLQSLINAGLSNSDIARSHNMHYAKISELRTLWNLKPNTAVNANRGATGLSRDIAALVTAKPHQAMRGVRFDDHPKADAAGKVGRLPNREARSMGGGSFGWLE